MNNIDVCLFINMRQDTDNNEFAVNRTSKGIKKCICIYSLDARNFTTREEKRE